jgi:hypothetical protein
MDIKKLINRIPTILLPIYGGLLGAIGGAGNKQVRRIGIPLLLSGFAYSQTENIFVFSIMAMAGVLSIGYGIPDKTDKGSFLGGFYLNLFKNNTLANVFTRGTIGLLIALTLVSIPLIKHNWIVYYLCSLEICVINAAISWRGFGTYKLSNKELSWVETITWGLITLFAVLIIYLK